MRLDAYCQLADFASASDHDQQSDCPMPAKC